MKTTHIVSSIVAATALGVSQTHAGQMVFFADFENGLIPAGITGAGTVVTTEGYAGFGFGEMYLRNDGTSLTTLTLTGLPAHTGISVSFSLAVIDSWDGSTGTGGVIFPDIFTLTVDGATAISDTFDNFVQSDGTFPGAALTFGTNLAQTPGWNDSAYQILALSGSTSDTLVISWSAGGAGFQGLDDESFAIDNINVQVTPVPEPGVWAALTGVVLLGYGLQRRLRR